jgi:hypothetical protein
MDGAAVASFKNNLPRPENAAPAAALMRCRGSSSAETGNADGGGCGDPTSCSLEMWTSGRPQIRGYRRPKTLGIAAPLRSSPVPDPVESP